MNKLVLFLALSVTVFAVSCSDAGKKEAIDKAEKEVFAVHDEVMPKLGEIMKLRKEISQQIATSDSLAGLSTSGTLRADEKKTEAILLNQHLNEADSLMMAWMNNYKGDSLKTLEPADALRYLDQEKQTITNVKQKINTSIEQARQFLAKP